MERDKGHVTCSAQWNWLNEVGSSFPVFESFNGFSESFLQSGLWNIGRPPWYKNVHSFALYIYIYIYEYMHICVCVCVCIYIYIYTHLHTHSHARAHTHTHTHTHTHIYIYIYIYLYMSIGYLSGKLRWCTSIRIHDVIFQQSVASNVTTCNISYTVP